MIVGLYKLNIKETPNRGELKFYSQVGETEVDALLPSITATVNEDDTEKTHTFIYDEKFSKEVGHHAYVKTNKKNPLTPFIVPSDTPIALPHKENEDTGNSGGAD